MELKDLGLERINFNKLNRKQLVSKEGDKGSRGLLVEFDKGLDCKLYLNDDTIIADEIEEGLYEIIYPDNFKKGIVKSEIKFYKGKEILSSFIFGIKVYKSLGKVEK